MRAVVLVVRLADFALQASPDLSTDTNAVSNFDGGNLVADFDGLADDFVPYADREIGLTPSTYECLSNSNPK